MHAVLRAITTNVLPRTNGSDVHPILPTNWMDLGRHAHLPLYCWCLLRSPCNGTPPDGCPHPSTNFRHTGNLSRKGGGEEEPKVTIREDVEKATRLLAQDLICWCQRGLARHSQVKGDKVNHKTTVVAVRVPTGVQEAQEMKGSSYQFLCVLGFPVGEGAYFSCDRPGVWLGKIEGLVFI